MSKAYSYLRFSSQRQAQGDSLRRQLALATAYALEHDLELDDVPIQDAGVSAFRGANRDAALGEFLRLVREGHIERGSYLLVESHDRMSRQNVETAMRQFLEIIELGIVVVTLMDSQVYRSGQVEMHHLMLSLVKMAQANEESVKKSERGSAVWSARRDAARESGSIIGNASLPTWICKSDGQFALNNDNVLIIQRMFDMAKAGRGYAQIAKALNDDEIPTFRSGTLWRSATIGSFLKNRSVIGEYQPHRMIDGERVSEGEAIIDYYPQIISAADFLDVNQQINQRNHHSGSYRRGSFNNLFSGILKCACGTPLTFHNKGTSERPNAYLVCNQAIATSCEAKNIRYKFLEPQVLAALSHTRPVIERILSQGHRDAEQLEAKAVLEIELGRIEGQVSNITQAISLGGDIPSLVIQLTQLNLQLEIKREEIVGLEHEIEVINASAQQLNMLSVDDYESPLERQAFNAQLKRGFQSMRVHWNEGQFSIEYLGFHGDSDVMLVQDFQDKLTASTVFDPDGHVVARTIKDSPYLDSGWLDSEAEIEPPEENSYVDIESLTVPTRRGRYRSLTES